MRPIRPIIHTILLSLCAIAAQVFAGEGVVGTWNLLSITTQSTDSGEVAQPYGEHLHGRLTCTSDGHMIVVLTAEGRKQMGANRFAGSVEDQAEAYKTMSAYAGTYTLTDTGFVHHVEVASIESWVGSDQVRFTKLEGDRLTIREPAPFLTSGWKTSCHYLGMGKDRIGRHDEMIIRESAIGSTGSRVPSPFIARYL